MAENKDMPNGKTITQDSIAENSEVVTEKDIIDKEEELLPSNSFKSKENRKEQPRVNKVIEAKKVSEKKAGNGFIEAVKDIIIYGWNEIIVPGMLDVLEDSFSEGIYRIFHRGRNDDRRRRRGRDTYISYSSYSRDRDDRREYSGRRYRDPERFEIDDIYMGSRAEADDVIEQMYDILDKYGEVRVADVYDMVGTRSTHIHQNWGWTDLRGLDKRRCGNEYLLLFPRPIYLD